MRLQPWLGLRARLFLAPISIPLISLLFVAFRLLASSNDANDSVSSAKTKLLSSCDAVEATASLAASLPHFLAGTTNQQLAQSVTATVHGAARVFDLSITAIEKILTYIVDSYRSLFVCFMELLVRGSLAVLIEAVQLISQAITAAAEGIRAAIQASVTGINALLSTAVGGINDVVGVFGQHITMPHIAMPSLTALENITLPHEVQDGLLKLNATLPTLQQLKDRMDALIETPFEKMRGEVNTTLGGLTFNHTVFDVPEMQKVTFCDRIDTSPLDDLGKELKRIAKWGLVLLGLVALVVMLVGVAWEWWKWQREVKAVARTRAVWLASPHQNDPNDEKAPAEDVLKTENLMSLLAISRHPLISDFALSVCNRVGIRTRRSQDRVAWLLSFLTHPAALACIFTGLLGLLSILLQTILIHNLSKHYSDSIDTSLTHLSGDVLNMVNDHTRNASLTFSASANAVISQVETELNAHVFNWVDTTTSTMNATLNEFLDGITDTLTSTFGGTPFNAPLQTFVQCIIGQKVRGIEKALTWIHDNAHVNFDRVPADVLMLQGEQGEAVTRPVKEALLGSGGDGNGGMVGSVMERYEKRLREERIMFLVLVGVYGTILVIGLLVVAYATLVDRGKGQDSGREQDYGEDMDEKLKTGLQAGPSLSIHTA
uniref:Plasma membrane fusion protein PRM1 n=1 Tax=Kalmanozyma brasiliensis (strain GHG001) TaxID=1365824 RepID=V5EPS3_KALBG